MHNAITPEVNQYGTDQSTNENKPTRPRPSTKAHHNKEKQDRSYAPIDKQTCHAAPPCPLKSSYLLTTYCSNIKMECKMFLI
jgi:hypothetical protein